MDPFTLRDADCWDCIAEELDITDPDLAKQLREALNDPMRDLRTSALAVFTVMYPAQIDIAITACRAQRRCSH
jgi:hypothetical protein